MSTRDRQLKELDALESLLDVYGADRTRWPARERLRFASLIADEPEAQRLMAEAVALDRLLDVAPAARKDQEQGLTGRIVAAARGQQYNPLSASQVSPAVSNIVKLPAWVRRPQIAGAFGASDWPAASLLAASLVLGVMLGSAGMLDSTVQEVAEVAGLSSSLTVESQLTLNEDTAAWAGEELL
ncbi:MAG: hypothetical protein GY877_05170 [Hyphomicrobium sp.]|nr:hypothetical protein [Hyphomicrobium sp.]